MYMYTCRTHTHTHEHTLTHTHTHTRKHKHTQNVSIRFINNTARLSGAAIYASDMQQCGWLGNLTTTTSLIFNPDLVDNSPFYYRYGRC